MVLVTVMETTVVATTELVAETKLVTVVVVLAVIELHVRAGSMHEQTVLTTLGF